MVCNHCTFLSVIAVLSTELRVNKVNFNTLPVPVIGLCSHLSPHVVDEAVHARFHAEAVLAWQQLWVPEAVEADAACQQRFELLHFRFGLCICGRKSEVSYILGYLCRSTDRILIASHVNCVSTAKSLINCRVGTKCTFKQTLHGL